MHHKLCQWKVETVLEQDGVIVGCTHHQEQLLPWWWMHYSMHNRSPVIFFDFGNMSKKARQWCKRKGELVTLSVPAEDFVVPKELVPHQHSSVWELHRDLNVWEARLAWFIKPFACLHSPFRRTVWLDLDCQTRHSIEPLFSYCQNKIGIALSEEPEEILKDHLESQLILEGEMEYNGGVIVFTHGAKIIQDWAEMCIKNNKILRGDQEALSRVANNKKLRLPTIPSKFNKRWHAGITQEDIIVHWLGSGKKIIIAQMELFESQAAYMNFSFD